MIVYITVTEQHIQNGLQQSCKFCPVALSVLDKLNQYYFTRVTPTCVKIYSVTSGEFADDCWLPIDIEKLIHRFDRSPNKEMYPFSFRIDIPQQYLR